MPLSVAERPAAGVESSDVGGRLGLPASVQRMSAPPHRPTTPRPPRLFVADDVLTGRVTLDNYPFRYILLGSGLTSALGAGLGGRSGANAMLDKILSAAEFLETRGWEVVSVDQGGTVVCLRRR